MRMKENFMNITPCKQMIEVIIIRFCISYNHKNVPSIKDGFQEPKLGGPTFLMVFHQFRKQ